MLLLITNQQKDEEVVQLTKRTVKTGTAEPGVWGSGVL